MITKDFIDVDGLQLAIYRAHAGGSARTVLACAPHNKSSRGYSGMGVVIDGLSDLVNGFTMEAPCTGESSDIPLDYFQSDGTTVRGLARLWERALVRAGVNLDGCILIGHCSGGLIASELVTYLGLQPRLVILSAPIFPSSDVSRRGEDRFVTRLPDGLWQYTLESYRILRPNATEEDVQLANERAYRVRPLRKWDLVDWNHFKYLADARSKVGKVVIIHPELDLFPLSERETLARDLGARLVVVPEGHHDPEEKTFPAWLQAYRTEVAAVL